MNIISINKEGCDANSITPGEVLLLLALHNNYDLEREQVSLINKGLITRMPTKDGIPGKYTCTRLGINILNNTIMDSIKLSTPNETINNLAKELKEIFPKGKKPETNYYWADGEQLIVRRLKLFFKKYGLFSNEDILDAAKRYVQSFNGDYRYMKLLKYFILKEKVGAAGDIESSSDLLNYLENKHQEDEENQNWMDEVR